MTLEQKLFFEQSLKDGYRGGRWHFRDQLYCYALIPQGPAIQLEMNEFAGFKSSYFPEFDKVGIFGKTPTTNYFQKWGSFEELGMFNGICPKIVRQFKILFLGERASYMLGITETLGRQARIIRLLKNTLKKTETSKKIIEQEKEKLDQSINNIYRAASCGY